MSSSSDKIFFKFAVAIFFFIARRLFRQKGECWSVEGEQSFRENQWLKVNCGEGKRPRRHSLTSMVLPGLSSRCSPSSSFLVQSPLSPRSPASVHAPWSACRENAYVDTPIRLTRSLPEVNECCRSPGNGRIELILLVAFHPVLGDIFGVP